MSPFQIGPRFVENRFHRNLVSSVDQSIHSYSIGPKPIPNRRLVRSEQNAQSLTEKGGHKSQDEANIDRL